MKTFIRPFIILLVFLGINISARAQATTLTINSVSGTPGSVISVPVMAQNIKDMQGFQFTIAYDNTKLEFQNCSDWSGGTKASGVMINALQGKIAFVYNDDPVNIASGKFFSLNFKIKSGVSGDAAITWSDDPTSRELSNSVPELINCSYVNGDVTINAAAQATLTINPVSGTPGSVISVPVMAQNIKDMQGFQFTIAYDNTKLEFQNCSDWGGGTKTSGVMINALQGKIAFVYNDDPVNITSGKFFSLNFKIKAGASGDAAITWSDNPTGRELSNSVPELINCSYVNGDVTIKTAAQPTLTINSVSGTPGSVISVPVMAQNIKDMQGFQFTIAYDNTKLEFQNCSDWGGGTKASGVMINALQGKIAFVYNDDPVNITSGKFFSLNFKIKSGASGDAAITWSDNPTGRELSNSVPELINCSYVNGDVTINGSVSLMAGFSASPKTGIAPLQVSFTDTTTGNPTSWSWDFGDGNTSTEQNPVHTYQSAGEYSVKLTVSDGNTSNAITKNNYISVTSQKNQIALLVVNKNSLNGYDKGFIPVLHSITTQYDTVDISDITKGTINLSNYKVVISNIMGYGSNASTYFNSVSEQIKNSLKNGSEYIVGSESVAILEKLGLIKCKLGSGWYPALNDTRAITSEVITSPLTQNVQNLPSYKNYLGKDGSLLSSYFNTGVYWKVINNYSGRTYGRSGYVYYPTFQFKGISSGFHCSSYEYPTAVEEYIFDNQRILNFGSFWTMNNAGHNRGWIGPGGTTILKNAINNYLTTDYKPASPGVVMDCYYTEGGNIALSSLGATATDNGSFNDYGLDQDAMLTIDNDSTTYWAGKQANSPQQMSITFDKKYPINKIHINERNDAFIKTGKVEYYDGTTWKTLFTINKTTPDITKSFSYVTAFKIRITVNSMKAPASWYNKVACINSVEVNGKCKIIHWNKVNNASHYEVWYSSDGKIWNPIGIIPQTNDTIYSWASPFTDNKLYKVRAVQEDTPGPFSSATQLAEVKADFSTDKTSGIAPLTVHFTDKSFGNPTSWKWDFNNDGIIDSHEQNPSYTYTSPGKYSVSLVVSNSGSNNKKTQTDYITVISNNPHFTPVWSGNPYQPMTIIVKSASIYGVSLKENDEIGVFSKIQNKEVCVGSTRVTTPITNNNPLSITVSADDPTTTAVDGFNNGGKIYFKLWDNTNKTLLQNVSVEYSPSFDKIFTTLGTAIVNLSGYAHFQTIWTGNPYQPMNILVDTVEMNNDTLNQGDEIGVFDVNSSGSEICVGAAIVSSPVSTKKPLSVIVSNDDPGISVIDGFTKGHKIIYRIWKVKNQKEISNFSAKYNPAFDAVFNPLGTAIVSLTQMTSLTQETALSSGWNMMSLYVTPDSMGMLKVLKPLVSSGSLIKAIDEKGGFVQNIPGVGWMNTIGDMANTEGYYIKVSKNDTLKSKGLPVDLPFSIPLQTGWNIMGYPVQSGQDAMKVLKTLMDSSQLVKVINEAGGFIQNIPGVGWMNTIGNFEPGEGYYIKVSHNTQITFNKPAKEVFVPELGNTAYNIPVSKYFKKAFSSNPYYPMNIVVTNIDLDGLQVHAGDEIAAFDKDVCVGVGVVPKDTERPVNIVASLDDPSTEQIDGYVPGDDMTLRYMSPKLGSPVTVTSTTLSGVSVFTPLETRVCGIAASAKSVESHLKNAQNAFRAYPNPVSSSVTFLLDNKESAQIEIELTDLNGRVVRVFCNKTLPAGTQTLHYDLSGLPASIYNIRVLRRSENNASLNNYKLVIAR